MSTDFGKRLKAAREHAGLTQEQLATRAGMAQSTLASAEASGFGSRKTPQLAAACGVDASWLATGEGPQPDFIVRTLAGETFILEARPVRPTPERGVGVAHRLSQARAIVLPKTIDWEELMTGELPPTFSLVVKDDAMAPDLRVGHQAIFSTSKDPAPGNNVLLVDNEGHAYIREYQQRRPGHWQAVARNAAYQPLDSITDGLRVLAVQIGALWG